MPSLQELRVVTSCPQCYRVLEDDIRKWKEVLQQDFEAMTKAKMRFVDDDIECELCGFVPSKASAENNNT